ncbi:Uncharacterised protein [Vibrio cholerae]|nr:Uncharacterised protein [Vibrio cholerae]
MNSHIKPQTLILLSVLIIDTLPSPQNQFR